MACLFFLPLYGNEAGTVLAYGGLAGMIWCALAACAANNLREKTAYLLGVHSAVSFWLVGRGCGDAALFFLVTTTPPAVLLGIGVSVLNDRLKFLDMDRLHGIGTQLPRIRLLLIFGMLGIAFFPGSSSFSGFVVVLEQAGPGAELWIAVGACVLAFLAGGQAFVSICFGDPPEEVRRAGDLNRRELWGVVPLEILSAAGLWPGLTQYLRTLVGL